MDWTDVLSGCPDLDQDMLHFIVETCKIDNPIDVLLFSPNELYELCDRKVAKSIFQQVWNHLAKQVSIQKYSSDSVCRLSFMNTRFDEYFGSRGIPSDCLIEIAGPGGAGKSNIALQLAISCLLTYPEHSVLYLCTEGNFPFRRLFDLLIQFCPSLSIEQIYCYTDRLLIQHIADHETLLHNIRYHLEVLISKQRVKLLVIDSIICDSRGEREFMHEGELMNSYNEIGKLLKIQAHKWNIFVVCINQVVDIVEPNLNVNYNEFITLERIPILAQCAPCLGISWANNVNMRIFVWREGTVGERRLVILWGSGKKQPFLPFSITQRGLALSTSLHQSPILID